MGDIERIQRVQPANLQPAPAQAVQRREQGASREHAHQQQSDILELHNEEEVAQEVAEHPKEESSPLNSLDLSA